MSSAWDMISRMMYDAGSIDLISPETEPARTGAVVASSASTAVAICSRRFHCSSIISVSRPCQVSVKVFAITLSPTLGGKGASVNRS